MGLQIPLDAHPLAEMDNLPFELFSTICHTRCGTLYLQTSPYERKIVLRWIQGWEGDRIPASLNTRLR